MKASAEGGRLSYGDGRSDSCIVRDADIANVKLHMVVLSVCKEKDRNVRVVV